MSVDYTPGFGTKPDDKTVGAYGYGGTNYDGTGGGLQGGFGIQSGMLGTPEGFHASSNLLKGNGFLGLNHEGAIGAGGSASVAHIEGGYGERGKGNYFNADADALGAGFDGWVNPQKGANLGASAYYAQGSITAGNIGTGAHDEESRIGVGAGVGAAGRLHWEDADHDGRREYGFGADIGPVSFDIKTEDPLLTMAKMSPLGMIAGPLASRFLPKDFNLTESVGGGIASGARALGGLASTVGGGIASGARALGGGIASGARTLGGLASTVGGGIANGARALGSGVSSIASTVGGGLASGARALGSGVSAAGSGLANGARAVGGGIASAASAVGGGLASGAHAVGSGVSSAASAVGKGVGRIFSGW